MVSRKGDTVTVSSPESEPKTIGQVVDAAIASVPDDQDCSVEIKVKAGTPEGENIVLNTCPETLRRLADDDDAPPNVNWTPFECREMADAFLTVQRRKKIMEAAAEAAKIAKKAYDTAVDIWFEKTAVSVNGQPEVDESGQRRMFASPPSTHPIAPPADDGVLARVGKAPATDDEIRHVISQCCEAKVWSDDLSRVGLSPAACVALDRANIRKPGDLLLHAARRGTRWWRDMGVQESEARNLMHRALGCLINMNDDVLPTARAMVGAHVGDQIDALDDDNAWPRLLGLLLDDRGLVDRVPAQSRERYERAAGHLTNAGVSDVGTAAVLLRLEPQWWFTRFPGIENDALDIEVFASALPLAVQDWARSTLLEQEPGDAPEEEPADDADADETDSED